MKFAYLIEPPFNYRSYDGVVTGCDVELVKAIAKAIGDDDLELVETEFSELLQGVSDGRWRMTTGLFGTKERKKAASFSNPIWALPDGLLVPLGNPLQLSGYKSVAANSACRLAVIRDQFQHRSAIEFGVSESNLLIFETYTDAANAVASGKVDAYASVGRAHSGYIELHKGFPFELTLVPSSEKEPAFGSFAFNKGDNELREAVNKVLKDYLGSKEHRSMMYRFGFSDHEIDLVVGASI